MIFIYHSTRGQALKLAKALLTKKVLIKKNLLKLKMERPASAAGHLEDHLEDQPPARLPGIHLHDLFLQTILYLVSR